ncbi:MAG: HIT family protein [Gammaproteobacteria bacterium]|nr:HIT family protein [Gammaproteobacteria bacterium]
MSEAGAIPCPLCSEPATPSVWADDRCVVVIAGEAAYPALCRVIWRRHVREMSDLAEPDRAHCLRVTLAVEAALRELLNPDKMNIASLGNQVPHLHWHVIPRFADDPHFPDAIWAPQRREGTRRAVDRGQLGELLAAALN